MGTFEKIYEDFRADRNHYFILLKRSASSSSFISEIFEGYESCKENLIYLISENVFSSLNKETLPIEASFLPISFHQFLKIIEKSPDTSSLKIVETNGLEIVIKSKDVKRYANIKRPRQKKQDKIFAGLLAIVLICVLALKALYFYVSYLFVFNILGMSGLFAVLCCVLFFILLNMISDKLLNNLLQGLKSDCPQK